MANTLFDIVKSLIACEERGRRIDEKEISHVLDREIDNALEGCERSNLSLNRSLYLIGKQYLSYSNERKQDLETSVLLFTLRTQLEAYLIRRSEQQIDIEIVEDIPESISLFSDYIREIIHRHPSNSHYIYERFIPEICSESQLKDYFVQEVTMDVNTDDFLASLQIGCHRNVKTEIARNYWDEMGCGKIERLHGALFEKIFESLGIDPNVEIEKITPEALVCGNLQNLLAMYRKFFPIGAGFFFTCEYMASGRFKKVVSGWNRLHLPAVGLEYHTLHIPLDVVHAKRWMENVVIPFSEVYPERKVDIVKGVLYRLNSSLEYLNMLEEMYSLDASTCLKVA